MDEKGGVFDSFIRNISKTANTILILKFEWHLSDSIYKKELIRFWLKSNRKLTWGRDLKKIKIV